jgi:hypothetical protein
LTKLIPIAATVLFGEDLQAKLATSFLSTLTAVVERSTSRKVLHRKHSTVSRTDS